jgi:hypothetical protein
VNASAIAGLLIMVVSETATLAGIEPFPQWNTPIAWTGFILFADGIVFRARGSSWLRSAPREFVFLAVMSVPLWLVFEWFNLFIRNWHYVGLPDNPALRYFGYAWSFATISPAIFEGAELAGVWRGSHRASTAPGAPSPAPRPRGKRPPLGARRAGSIVVGAALLVWPIVWPSQYLAAPVWLGFIFLLDPINDYFGLESLLGDLRLQYYDRLINLVLSGFLCGILWEFWNYWSRAKWHYTVPIMENLKIFEMPVPGYFGFPPFALECFTMYVTVRAVAVALTGAPFGRPVGR